MRDEILEVLDTATDRRAQRRNFLRSSLGATAAVGGLALLAACDDGESPDEDDGNDFGNVSPTPTNTGVNIDVLNFALQLETLAAQYYSFAVNGTGLAANLQLGVGTQGAVAGTGTGAGQPRAVAFGTETLIAEYAREIAADKLAHVTFLRAQLGQAAVAQPAINISGDATGAFTAAARAAGIVGATGTFDPYASVDNFLLGAFLFEDIFPTTYKGAVGLLTTAAFIEAAAGIHAADSYHAGLIRTVLYARGQTNASLITNAGLISNARDSLDGASDLDQGIAANGNASNLVPVDADAIIFARNSNQVLHIVYLNATAGVSSGGFFPAGLNGNIRVAAANP